MPSLPELLASATPRPWLVPSAEIVADDVLIPHAVNNFEPLLELAEVFAAYLVQPDAFTVLVLETQVRAVLRAARMEE